MRKLRNKCAHTKQTRTAGVSDLGSLAIAFEQLRNGVVHLSADPIPCVQRSGVCGRAACARRACTRIPRPVWLTKGAADAG